MKLVTFLNTGNVRLGALVTLNGEEIVVDLNAVDARIPSTLIAFLEAGDSLRDLAEWAINSAKM